MRHCKHCDGPCVSRPSVIPQKIGTGPGDIKDVKAENIYKRENWGVNIDLTSPYRGYVLHFHSEEIYGVFNHYFGPNGSPIMICSFCEAPIPANIYNHLKAMLSLWTKG